MSAPKSEPLAPPTDLAPEETAPQRTEARPWYKTLLRVVAALTVAGFIVWSAFRLAERWSESPKVDVEWRWAVASAVPLLLASWLHALGWLHIVRRLATSESLRSLAAVRLFLASILGRYVPGKVGMPAILLAGARAVGLPRGVVGSSLLLMVLVYVVTGLAVGILAVALTSTTPGNHELLSEASAKAMTAVLVAGTLLLAFVDRRYLPARIRKLVGTGSTGAFLPWSSIALFVLTWGLWLCHGVCLSASVGGSWSTAWSTSGYFSLAPVIGVLAIVTPGGIGVREAVIVAGCTPLLGAAPALTVALLSRVISLTVELLAWLGSSIIERGTQTAK